MHILFKREGPMTAAEYEKFRKQNSGLVFVIYILITLLTAVSPVQLLAGIKLMTAVGALAFETDTYVSGLGTVIIVFSVSVIAEAILRRLFYSIRQKLAIKADTYIATLIREGGSLGDRAYACKSAFADALDEKYVFIRNITFLVSLGFFSAYVNVYAGVPLIIFVVWNVYFGLIGKDSKLLRVVATLAFQAYLFSLIFLILFRVESYGALIGYYTALMFKNDASKDIAEGIGKRAMNIARLEAIESFLKIPEEERKKCKADEDAALEAAEAEAEAENAKIGAKA